MASNRDQDRQSARKRGYSTRWDKAASTFKQKHPYCLGCKALGRISRTEVVDHVVPHKGDQSVFWDTAQWQPSCAWHHNSVKPQLERLFAKGEIPIAELWLTSETAKRIGCKASRQIGPDGWPK